MHYLKVILHSIFLFVLYTNIAYSQSETLNIKPYGIQFKDGSSQNSAPAPLNSGSAIAWFVYVEYSNGIEGGVTIPTYENHSHVLKIHHEVFQELNQNGIPNGVKHHRALMLTKDIDQASPDIFQAYDNNLTLDSLTIKFTREVQNGTFPEKFRITLYNVKIKEINTHLAFSNATDYFQGEENIFLIYQSMEVRHFNPNESHTLIYQY